MPLDRAALAATDKLYARDVPGLAAGEFVEIRHQRAFPDDLAAEMASYRRLPPLPRPGETEADAAAREPEVRLDQSLYYRGVFDRNCVRLHLQDETGAWLDADPARPAGSERDRADVWAAFGAALMPALMAREGSIIGAVPEGAVNAMGEAAKSGGLPAGGDPPDGAGTPDAVGDSPGGAGAAAQDDPQP